MHAPTTIDSSPLRSRAAAVASLVLCAALASADTATAHPAAGISERELVTAVNRRAPERARQAAATARARAAAARLGVAPNPQLIFDREHVFGDGSSGAETSVGLGWSIELSGRRTRAKRAAGHMARATALSGQASRLRAQFDAMVVYRHGVYARLKLALLEAERKPLARVLATLAARVKAGDVAGYDLARLRLELGVYDDRITSARNELLRAQRDIAHLMGDPSGQRAPTDDLRLPVVATDAKALATGAAEAHPTYRAHAQRLRAADTRRGAAQRWWIPTLNVSGGFKRADAASGYFAGVTVDIPLFSRRAPDTAHAEAGAQDARAAMRIMARDVPARITNSRDMLRRAVAQARRFESTQISQIAALLKKANIRYRGGEGSIVELLDAYRLARDVRLQRLSLRYAASRAEVALWRAVGRLPWSK